MHKTPSCYSPKNLYTAKDVRELDRLAIEEHGIAGYSLMQRAGKAAFMALLKKWPSATTLITFCGKGNNGGDGYVIAGLARQHGLNAKLFYVADPAQLKGSARKAFDFASEQKVSMTAFKPGHPVNDALNDTLYDTLYDNQGQTIIVDALLGTGIRGDVSGDYRAAIELINQTGLPVLAVDIPSGLCSDTGKILGIAARATLTVSFIGLKIGQTIDSGPTCCGELLYESLDVPKDIFDQVKAVGRLEPEKF